MKLGRKFWKRITGISTPVGGLSWEPKSNEAPIESFVGTVCITLAENDAFIRFLERNTGKIAFVDAWLDSSVAIEEQWRRAEEEGLDLDEFSSGRLSGATLPLPSRGQDIVGAKFHLLGDRLLHLSTGGTGTLRCQVTGFFHVSTALHSGPSRTFHLREVEAPIDLWSRFQG